MRVTILCNSPTHPVNAQIEKWVKRHESTLQIKVARSKKDLTGGDILFLISCNEIIGAQARRSYTKTLVIHASDLPLGRGWSPHIWQILEGASQITVTLLEAEDTVDGGDIWKKIGATIPPFALWDEINQIIFDAELSLMDFAIQHFRTVSPQPQTASVTPSYYPRRTPKDSQIDPNKTIRDQFDLIRVCDPNRFPAFFEHRGARYSIRLEKLDEK